MPQSFLQILTIPFSQTAPKLQTVLATGVPGTTVIAPKTAGTGQQVLAILSPQKAGIPPQQQVLCRISNLFLFTMPFGSHPQLVSSGTVQGFLINEMKSIYFKYDGNLYC
mgnify:CR=1 FL=1